MDGDHDVLARKKNKKRPRLGVIRLDYNYEPAVGDIDHPLTYTNYEVYYRTPCLFRSNMKKGSEKGVILIPNEINPISVYFV